MIKLLFRFYDPTSGRILIDGIDMRDLDPKEWYSHLGSLFQKYTNYQLPLREAIGIANLKKDADDVSMRDSLEKSEALSFVE